MQNRVIKFRAWQGIKSNGKKSMMKKRMIGWSEISRGWSFYEFQNAGLYDRILMQFTGLTDKNGVEIYEGDVVRECEETFPEDRQPDQVVEFNAGAFYPVCMQPSTTFEVIGNVFENPELLNP